MIFDRHEVTDFLEAPTPDGWALEEARRILRVTDPTTALLHQKCLIMAVRAKPPFAQACHHGVPGGVG
jgi:hypothetical protein